MDTKKKPTLLIISDLWGFESAEWLSFYTEKLYPDFSIRLYDCYVLGCSNTALTESERHQQLISGGIDKCIEHILQKEKEKVYVLGLSIGGYIAWKAALKGLTIQYLCAVSSTRLRYETQKPSGTVQLIYGEKDSFKPAQQWFKAMSYSPIIYPHETHILYRNPAIVQEIASLLIQKYLLEKNT